MKPVLRLLLGAGLVAGLALGVAQLLPRRPAPARVGIAGTTPAPIRVEPAPEPAALRSLLDPATATDTERLAACHALPATLDAAHRATLLRHLDGPCPANCKPAHWHALWNDALNSLRRQGAGADELAIFLERNATRTDCDPVIRDYALQHMRALLADSDANYLRVEDPALRERLFAVLSSAATRVDTTAAGTALLALNHCDENRHGGEPAPAAIDALVLSACGEGASDLVRITAFQLAARRSLHAALPELRRMAAADARGPLSLRASACAALGVLGDATDLPLLEQAASNNPRLALAARPALNRLQAATTSSTPSN